jgi:CheY-like chemotaxis protein
VRGAELAGETASCARVSLSSSAMAMQRRRRLHLRAGSTAFPRILDLHLRAHWPIGVKPCSDFKPIKPAMAARSSRPVTRDRKLLQALIVDDDELIRTVLGDMLRDLGVVHVAMAADGAAGVAALERSHVPTDVVLCDLNMPGNDGFQFMEQLAERGFPGGVVLISGMDERVRNSATLMAKLHQLNILATLRKPVDVADLRSALTQLT